MNGNTENQLNFIPHWVDTKVSAPGCQMASA